MELSDKEWIDLLSGDYPRSREKTIIVSELRKPRTFYIRKQEWSKYFSDFGGVTFKQGREIEITRGKGGGNKTELPEWVLSRLALSPSDVVCITEREQKFYIKKLELSEQLTQIPGRIVVDRFEDSFVRRTYSGITNLNRITCFGLHRLLSKMGRFRYDPIASFKQISGRTGFLARKQFMGGLTKDDKRAIRAYKKQIANTQQSNGSWDDHTVKTAFNLIRLIEIGASLEEGAVEKATKWLLSTTEPVGLPGLFISSEKLVHRFNNWKEKPGAKGRPYRKVFSCIPISELQVFFDNLDVLANASNTFCEVRITWPSAIAIEALLRCGLENEKRVKRGINTLLILRRGGRWCGCGYLEARIHIPESTDPIDFDQRFPLPQKNEEIYHLDWFSERNDILKLTCNDHCKSLEIDKRKALLVKHFRTTGDCSLVVHRALSYHPKYHGSNLETIAALECSYRQNSYGKWGDAYLSSMFDYLERFAHSLSAFLILRSIPFLIREQRTDGFWQEKPRIRGAEKIPLPKKEVSTFMILKALKRFGFLDALILD